MPVDPISESLWNEILKYAREEAKKGEASGYWTRCPSCGRRVVKKQLIKNGCYLCGRKKDDIPEVQSKKEVPIPYRTKCPKCGRLVIREELMKKGCFLCGYKPEVEVK